MSCGAVEAALNPALKLTPRPGQVVRTAPQELLSLGGQHEPGSGLPPPPPSTRPQPAVDSSVAAHDLMRGGRLQVEAAFYQPAQHSIDWWTLMPMRSEH